LRLAKSKVIDEFHVGRGEAKEFFTFSCASSIFNIKKCKKAASRKMDRNCLVFLPIATGHCS
jgi:hypothetical protein